MLTRVYGEATQLSGREQVAAVARDLAQDNETCTGV